MKESKVPLSKKPLKKLKWRTMGNVAKTKYIADCDLFVNINEIIDFINEEPTPSKRKPHWTDASGAHPIIMGRNSRENNDEISTEPTQSNCVLDTSTGDGKNARCISKALHDCPQEKKCLCIANWRHCPCIDENDCKCQTPKEEPLRRILVDYKLSDRGESMGLDEAVVKIEKMIDVAQRQARVETIEAVKKIFHKHKSPDRMTIRSEEWVELLKKLT